MCLSAYTIEAAPRPRKGRMSSGRGGISQYTAREGGIRRARAESALSPGMQVSKGPRLKEEHLQPAMLPSMFPIVALALAALALAACSREPAAPTLAPTATLPPTLAPTATATFPPAATSTPAPPTPAPPAATATLPPTATAAPTARPTPQSASRPSAPTRPSVPARPAPTPTQAPTPPPPTATATLAPTATPTPAPPTPPPTAAPTPTPTPAPSAVWRADLPVGSRPGDRAPDATLTLADGSSSTIEEAAAGRSVLLYFFATW